MNQSHLTLLDISLIFVYLLFIVFGFYVISRTKYRDDALQNKIFVLGFLFKIFAGIGFAIIYDFYYARQGDSFYYFWNASYMGEMLFSNPSAYFRMLFDMVTPANIHELSYNLTYFPRFNDTAIYAIHRYVSIFTILGLRNYYLTTICLSAFMFLLNWRSYLFFNELFPQYRKAIAVAILFIPSVVFWSSGIAKDTFTLSFALLFVVYFYRLVFQRRFRVFTILKLLFCIYIILSLKPYIFYALLTSGFVWLGFAHLHKIKNTVIRVFVLPLIILVVGFVGLWALSAVMQFVGGSYADFDAMLNKAVITQQDLKQDYYQGMSFDIGDFDASIEGALSVTPAAVIAGLFRPFIWESRSAVMLLSGLENLALLLLTLYVFIRIGFRRLFRELGENPFLIFCFVFSISMALGVGLSTSNFGALVRFKIPLIPFLAMALLIIIQNYKQGKAIDNMDS